MIRRAIILVPGFSKREQNSARDELVQSLLHYTDGWDCAVADAKKNEGQDVVYVTANARQGDAAFCLGVYEAYWGDLVPDWSHESPWARFKRGTSLISYWVVGGIAKALIRRELPQRTMVAMVLTGLALLLWYVVVFLVLLKAIADGTSPGTTELPKLLTDITDLIGVTDWLTTTAGTIAAWPISVFLIGLLGLGWLERIVNISAFTKAYLRDDVIGEGTVGLRAKSRKRVLAVLDHVYERQGDDAYDEVYVVAHSLGGGIAVDALAEYGDRLGKTTLLTWGTAVGALVQQEPLIEAEIRKFYDTDKPIRNWVDVVFPGDFMGSKVPVPLRAQRDKGGDRRVKQIFPDTVEPPLPRGYLPFSRAVHDGYYRCEDAVLMLVKPGEDLPQGPQNDPQEVGKADEDRPAPSAETRG